MRPRFSYQKRSRIQSVAMDRHETRIDALDLATNERRQFRLDRITQDEVLEG